MLDMAAMIRKSTDSETRKACGGFIFSYTWPLPSKAMKKLLPSLSRVLRPLSYGHTLDGFNTTNSLLVSTKPAKRGKSRNIV